MTPQPLPDTIPLSEAHTYLPQLHQAGVSTPALPNEIPLSDAHSYLPQIMSFGAASPAALPTANIPNSSAGSPDKSAMQNLVATATNAAFGESEVAPMLSIVKSESGFNPQAQNPHSSAYGLGQFLDSTWGGTGIAKTNDPTAQTQAMLKYVKKRYGSPSQALAFRQAHGWY